MSPFSPLGGADGAGRVDNLGTPNSLTSLTGLTGGDLRRYYIETDPGPLYDG